MMIYKLLDNATGVILTRQPEMLREDEELCVQFNNNDPDATAIFQPKDGDSLYRSLSDGLCCVPATKLCGAVSVTVANLNGKTPIKRWICEELNVEKKNGGYLISPNDMNLPQVVVSLRLENEELRCAQAKQEAEIQELREMLTEIIEGYNLT